MTPPRPVLNPNASRSLHSDEPTVAITASVQVPQSRHAEWMRGTRPLDGMDADFYFRSAVQTGLITREQALDLHKRHLLLGRQEEAAANGALICQTCHGAPPPGFACTVCGTAAEREDRG